MEMEKSTGARHGGVFRCFYGTTTMAFRPSPLQFIEFDCQLLLEVWVFSKVML